MGNRIFFRETCPKCKEYQTFNILNSSCETKPLYARSFIKDDWREYDYDLFSISSSCNNCKHYVSGSLAAIRDELKNSSEMLSDFALENGEIIQDEKIFIEFDVPPLKPQQHFSSPPVADMHYLFKQANRCYDIHAWDAVVILCRKIVDIQSADMWRKLFGTKPKSNLHERVKEVLASGEVFVKDLSIEEQLDYSNENHRFLYDIEQIRFLGNHAAHSALYIDMDDAEIAMSYTQRFINAYYEWSRTNSELIETVKVREKI